ncbi:hypothetical protein [Bacillus thuringiensis]|uniref:hypothetical protein n=1 Tax=Bacillus thuringiensis TaxID=1428 RepID=UPI0037C6A4FB
MTHYKRAVQEAKVACPYINPKIRRFNKYMVFVLDSGASRTISNPLYKEPSIQEIEEFEIKRMEFIYHYLGKEYQCTDYAYRYLRENKILKDLIENKVYK